MVLEISDMTSEGQFGLSAFRLSSKKLEEGEKQKDEVFARG